MIALGLDLSPWKLPVLIFVAEMCVVAVSTVRIIVMGRGLKMLAVGLGCVEITLWLFAIRQIMSNLADPRCFLAFAGGFTLGNYLGITLEEKMALGSMVVRVVTRRDAGPLVDGLRQASFGVTCIPAQGATGPVQVILTVVKRRQLPEVAAIVKGFDPRAFYSVDNLHSTAAGIFPLNRRHVPQPLCLELQRAG